MRFIAWSSAVISLLSLASAASFAAVESPPSPWNAYYGFRGMTCSAATAAAAAAAAEAAAENEFGMGYYGVDMVPTRRVPGTGSAVGTGHVTFSPSPFLVSTAKDGAYVYDVRLRLDRVKKPKSGILTAWAAKSDLSEIRKLGTLGEDLGAEGTVSWNKFLLVVTLEPGSGSGSGSGSGNDDRWKGPIVMRGMSRSGLMHTLAGHGPYEKEPCSKYGFK
jgi:hypothetical protein